MENLELRPICLHLCFHELLVNGASLGLEMLSIARQHT